ncbi:MAG: carboxypeptidase-like regulatory domain-containing protein [Elusimicrobiales bacterium]|nr:carboxypeptidase-like regulatory domain-containing protein [Elusimicrobiales bacterium]
MSKRKGVSLTELMIAVTILTVGVVGGMGAFKFINRAMTQSRIKTIAINLAQEKMEVLKNKSYYQLQVTTETLPSSGFSPNFTYDSTTYPPQTITLWGMPALTRVVKVEYITLNGSVPTPLLPTDEDPGMKRITVTVMWSEGGEPKKVQFSSYYENPNTEMLNAGFRGQISYTPGASAVPVGDALVQVMGAPKWRATSDASGNYSFQVAPGTYTLVCSSDVYYSTMSPTLSVTAGAYTTYNFSLMKIATGSVSGLAYIRDHLVISQVVGASVTVAGFSQEWIEVYNPTTWTWTMATGLNSGLVGLGYKINTQPALLITNDYATLTLGPQRYYLFANAASIEAGGTTRAADAVFSNSNPNFPNIIKINTDPGNDAAEVSLVDLALSQALDKVAWKTGGNSFGGEGEPIDQFTGLQLSEQFIRKSHASMLASGSGRAYDANNNNTDFYVLSSVIYPPRNSATQETAVTGTPAAGGIVTVNDGLSSSALVSATGYFYLTNVATCAALNTVSTWTVTVASYTVFNSSAGLYIAAGQNKDVGTLVLSTTVPGGIATGYVFGSGPDQYRPLGNPSIKVGAGGVTANTDSQGFYMLFLSTGLVTITANYGSANGSYQSVDAEVDIPLGGITQVPDFHIAQGGYLTGYVTSGTGVLPNVVVQATNGGPVYEDTSDSTGHFYIYAATSAVAYTINPVLDPLQSYTSLPTTPLEADMAVPGSTVFTGTITIVGALGTITGTVVASSVAVTTGVLVVASTGTVSDPLPSIAAATSASEIIYYSASSQADGTYSLEVRSSTTTPYNMRAYYPVVNANSGAVTYTSRTSTGVYVNAGGTATRDFAW